MEGLIDLELASELERKTFLAFLKGLTQIKFQSQLRKVEQQRSHQSGSAAAEEAQDNEMASIDLEYLYTNLFQGSTGLQSEQFN